MCSGVFGSVQELRYVSLLTRVANIISKISLGKVFGIKNISKKAPILLLLYLVYVQSSGRYYVWAIDKV